MKSSIFNLIFTVFLLWLTIQIPSNYEVYLAYCFVLTIGILHGANDIALIGLITSKTNKVKHKYLFLYVGLIGATTIAFIMFPLLALLIFIGFSCYHFGEQHFFNFVKKSSLKSKLLFFSYGSLIFGLLFFLNSGHTSIIIEELTGLQVIENHYLIFLLFGIVATIVSVYLNSNNFKSGLDYFQEFFLILLFATIFKLASLLWAFAIFFVVWHSIPSLKDQVDALYGGLNQSSFSKYLKSSLLNWIISLLGLFVVYLISMYMKVSFISLFFAFLAAITIPHVIVMFHLNKK